MTLLLTNVKIFTQKFDYTKVKSKVDDQADTKQVSKLGRGTGQDKVRLATETG